MIILTNFLHQANGRRRHRCPTTRGPTLKLAGIFECRARKSPPLGAPHGSLPAAHNSQRKRSILRRQRCRSSRSVRRIRVHVGLSLGLATSLYCMERQVVAGDTLHETTRYGMASNVSSTRQKSLGVVYRNWHPGPLGFQVIADSFAYFYEGAARPRHDSNAHR